MSRPRSPHWDNADSPSRFRTACRHSGGTEAAVLARGRVEAFRFNDLGLLNRRDHHLRDTSSTPDFEAFVAQIYKNDLYFAPIIGIDCSWRIEDRDAVANCESERGGIWPSCPGGNATAIPIGMATRSPGAILTGISAGTAAKRSIPAACAV